jgi:hypothetical protein
MHITRRDLLDERRLADELALGPQNSASGPAELAPCNLCGSNPPSSQSRGIGPKVLMQSLYLPSCGVDGGRRPSALSCTMCPPSLRSQVGSNEPNKVHSSPLFLVPSAPGVRPPENLLVFMRDDRQRESLICLGS